MLLPSFWTVRLEQPISKLGVRVIESTMATSTYFNSLSSSVVFYCYPERKMKGPWTEFIWRCITFCQRGNFWCPNRFITTGRRDTEAPAIKCKRATSLWGLLFSIKSFNISLVVIAVFGFTYKEVLTDYGNWKTGLWCVYLPGSLELLVVKDFTETVFK